MESLAKFFNHDFKEGPFKLYDKKGNMIYHEDANKRWYNRKFNKNGNETYYGNSDGFWYVKEYDENQIVVYYKTSNGRIMDKRPKCENKTVIIDGIEYELRRKNNG